LSVFTRKVPRNIRKQVYFGTFQTKTDQTWTFFGWDLYIRLAEVPGAARVNLQHALHILFNKQFTNKFLSAFRVSGSPGVRGQDQNCTKTFLGQVGMCVHNFIKRRTGAWISISPPHANRHTSVCTFCIYRLQ